MTDKSEVNELAKQMMQEEIEKNNIIAENICKEIIEDIDIEKYDTTDTSITIFVRVRKGDKITSFGGGYKLKSSTFTRPIDFYQSKLAFESILNKKI